MALDGIVVAALARELDACLTEGRIYKIAQPEPDELLITVRKEKEQFLLLLSAGASLPLVYLTDEKKASPAAAPNFCMLLRKYIQNGRILSVTQPGLERILVFEIEHRSELGDLCRKYMRVELMGKHSNIIFCDHQDKIIDSIKHISAQISSVREVLPGRTYFIPETMEKHSPLAVTETEFCQALEAKPMPVKKALYQAFTGISPMIGEEVCFRASLESDRPFSALTEAERIHLYRCFSSLMEDVAAGQFAPCIIYDEGEPVEFSAVELRQYGDLEHVSCESISQVLRTYYGERNVKSRIRQRSSDLRRIVQTALERNVKKYDLQRRQMKDTEKKDKYKVYGELLHTYGYMAEPGAKFLEAENYYTNSMVKIPLDPQLTPQENAKKYFDRYGKLKRTREALEPLLLETKAEIDHLESVSDALDTARQEEDLLQIREELALSGHIRRKSGEKKQKITSRPFCYVSSDGFEIYVGKNNLQNEELTFHLASGNDWWFHAKGIPGSHVILKTDGKTPPDRTFEEAARLAAHYSRARGGQRAEVDYVEKKHVKKPKGGKPGFVIYHTNYSMVAETDISDISFAPKKQNI